MQFELILARQITCGSWGPGPMIFYAHNAIFPLFFIRFARYFFKQTFNKNVPKTLIKHNNLNNITVNTLNDFRVEPLKRRLPSDVTFVTVLRHMCWTFSVRYNMYLSIHVLFYVCFVNYLSC